MKDMLWRRVADTMSVVWNPVKELKVNFSESDIKLILFSSGIR